jgi:hypothetical protein
MFFKYSGFLIPVINWFVKSVTDKEMMDVDKFSCIL